MLIFLFIIVGKTTQVPQFLYEAGYTCNIHNNTNTTNNNNTNTNNNSDYSDIDGGAIVITQPRRIAAVSSAHRIAQELG